MKKLDCNAVLHKDDHHLLYFTLDDNILNKTEWLFDNCFVKKFTLTKQKGFISYKMNGVPYTIHSEDSVFYNLPESFYYDVFHHRNYNSDTLESWLLNSLPHGSGIDYDWSFEYLKNGKIQGFNSYHAMNEYGMYCHIYDFMVTLHITHKFTLTFERVNLIKGCKEYACCGYDLRSYLSDTIAESLH